jgi:hypothetical protein
MPLPASKCAPSRTSTNAYTRASGSFSTSLPRTNIAKVFPFTRSPFEPNLRRDVSGASTFDISAKASASLSKATDDGDVDDACSA